MVRCIPVVPNLRLSGMCYRRQRGPPSGGFFCKECRILDIFVYSDESGVFDKAHNDIFVFAGLIFLDKATKDGAARKYIRAERALDTELPRGAELKACVLPNAQKGKLFRALNQYYKFSCTIQEKRVLDNIFHNSKDKQRYLDFAYKIAVKRAFEKMIGENLIAPEEVKQIFFCVDEHSTATSGIYELRESMEQEFKRGTYNWNFATHYPPIFPKLQGVSLRFCNSASTTLVRAADIVANKAYHLSRIGDMDTLQEKMYSAITLP